MKTSIPLAVGVTVAALVLIPSPSAQADQLPASAAGINTAGYSSWKATAAAFDSSNALAGMRLFDTGTVLSTPAELPADGRTVTLSWNPVSGTTATGKYNAAVQALITAAQPIYLSEEHEPDVSAAQKRKSFNYAGWLDDNEHLLAQTAGTNVTTCVILSAYWMATDIPIYVTPLIPYGLTCVGIDFDGINPSSSGGRYPFSYFDAAFAKVPILKADGITTLLAPEFGSELATWDPTGSVRAAWITNYAAEFAADGFAQVDWFDNGKCGVGGYDLCDAPSKAAWRAVIGANSPPSNAPPVARTSVNCTALTCSFDGSTSVDPDGTITAYAWTFGDGNTSTDATTTNTYAAGGAYPVTLTVTDNDGATSVWTGSVNPSVSGTSVNFVGVADFNGSSANPSVTVPAGVSPGDTELIFVSVNTAGITTSLPTGLTGWTQLTKLTNSNLETTVFGRTAVAGDAGRTVSVRLTKAERLDMQLVDYTGVATGSVPFTTARDNTTSTHVAPAISVTPSGSWVLTYWSDRSSGTTKWTLPAAVSARKVAVGTGNARVSGVIADSGAPTPSRCPSEPYRNDERHQRARQHDQHRSRSCGIRLPRRAGTEESPQATGGRERSPPAGRCGGASPDE